MVKKIEGFTLIELMIVVAIIAILAAFAYPSYQEYVRNTKRTEMQATMQQIAMDAQKHKIANFTLVGVGLTDLGAVSSYPVQGMPLYNVSFAPVDGNGRLTSNSWTLTAQPILTSTQSGNGHIVLNSRGERCWIKGTDTAGTACIPSSTTNWDGK